MQGEEIEAARKAVGARVNVIDDSGTTDTIIEIDGVEYPFNYVKDMHGLHEFECPSYDTWERARIEEAVDEHADRTGLFR